MIPAGTDVVSAHTLEKKDLHGFRKIFSASPLLSLQIYIAMCMKVSFGPKFYANFFCNICSTDNPKIVDYVIDCLQIFAFAFLLALMLESFL